MNSDPILPVHRFARPERRGMVIVVMLVTVLWCLPVMAEDFESFGKQMTYFYLSPSQAGFNQIQSQADQYHEKLEGSDNGADIIVAVMIARISQKHHWPIHDGAFGERARVIVEGKSRLAKYINDDTRVDPTKLDIWWGSFFATGDEVYLEKLFQYAGQAIPENGLMEKLTVGSAQWSFKSNCRQHRKVLAFAEQKLKSPSLTESQTRFIKACMAYAAKQDNPQATN
jgi:hypothetical protein